MTMPLVDVWVTSTGRECAISCVQETVKQCKYPNYRMLIFESNPHNRHGTVDVFKSLPCEKKVWTGDFPPLGWIYNLLMFHTDRFIQRLDDDCWPVCDPSGQWVDAMSMLSSGPLAGHVFSHIATECNPRVAYDPESNTVPDAMKQDPTLSHVMTATGIGPILCYRHPSGISLMDKRLVLPWNETCHWRQVELYHILDHEQRGLLCAYMLKWWGCIGHFCAEGVDGVDRSRQANLYEIYRDRGYVGLRPQSTWGTSFMGADIPEQEAARA